MNDRRVVSVALVHHPVLARDGDTVTTSITNLDIHDIARSAFTLGVDRYFLVHPVLAQRQLAERIIEHWTEGSGARRIPDRRPPMERVRVVDSLEDAVAACSTGEHRAETWVTSAQRIAGAVGHTQARQALSQPGPPVLLVLGTGWGLAPELVAESDCALLPITSPRADGYNHLSVRAAAAILLDRLLGQLD